MNVDTQLYDVDSMTSGHDACTQPLKRLRATTPSDPPNAVCHQFGSSAHHYIARRCGTGDQLRRRNAPNDTTQRPTSHSSISESSISNQSTALRTYTTTKISLEVAPTTSLLAGCEFSFGCQLFTVSNSGLLFRRIRSAS